MKFTRKTVAGSPSGEESQDPDGKGSTTSWVENGMRVCEKVGFTSEGLDGGVSVVNNKSREKMVPLVDGNGEDLEDSEMNGVSSLLEMQQSGGHPGLDSVLDVIDKNERKGFGDGGEKQGEVGLPGGATEGESEGKLEGGDEMDELDFDVGDFVWGKIKSHPWWPGRVYDPLDASEQAKKVKHGENRILVAYFGDGTFAWCNPSQLKPFHENFVEMVKQSTSKNFVNAVEKALEEVGRSIDLSLTCSCVPRDNLFGFGRSLAANAGVKDGLLVPEGGDFSDSNLFNPENVFHSIKTISKFVRFGNALELVIVKSSLSAFYRAKAGSKLQAFYEPTEISGLEHDESLQWMTGDQSNQMDNLVEGTFSGPVEEDWVSSSVGQDAQNPLQISLVSTERLAPRRRKQKSIAEIISGSPNAETEAEASASKTASRRKKRTSKSEVEVVENPEPSGSKKRKVGSSPKVTDVAKTEANSGDRPAFFSAKISKASNEVASSGQRKSENTEVPAESRRSKRSKQANVEAPSDSVSGQRKRKDREVSESPVTAANGETSAIEVKSPVSRRRKKREDINVVIDDSQGRTEEAAEKKIDGGSSAQNEDDKGKATSENVASPRERKKSRYLSPPYTNITIGQRPKMKVSGESQSKTEAAGHHSNGVNSGEELSKEQTTVEEKPDDLVPETPKDQTSTIEARAARAAASQFLCYIQSAALDPFHVEESEHLDHVLGFVSELRSSGHNGEASNYEQNIKPKQGRKKKKSQEVSESNPISPDDPKSRQNMESQKSDKPIAATLYVTFGPGSSLPSKDDLLRIYRPFGALNRAETDMFYNNRCARIAFSSIPEAEEALGHSQRSSPFGTSHVTFRLRFPSPPFKAGEPVPSSALHCIIEKLETVDSMLKSSSSEEMTPTELKSRVGGEIRGVIEKLNALVRPSMVKPPGRSG